MHGLGMEQVDIWRDQGSGIRDQEGGKGREEAVGCY